VCKNFNAKICNFQSKWKSKLAIESSTFTMPRLMPGHILLSAPNGIN